MFHLFKMLALRLHVSSLCVSSESSDFEKIIDVKIGATSFNSFTIVRSA
jgi:hypothetical protein